MATWDGETTCWLLTPRVAARYTLEFDGKGRFLMRIIDAAGQSPPGALAGGAVIDLCRQLAASLPGCAVAYDRFEFPANVHNSCSRWRDVAALLNGKGTVKRAVAMESYGVRQRWVDKYLDWDRVKLFLPSAVGLAADAKADADQSAHAAKAAAETPDGAAS